MGDSYNLQEILFLNLDTFKNRDFDCYKDLSKCYKTITWLQVFLYQWTHEWWVESNLCDQLWVTDDDL